MRRILSKPPDLYNLNPIFLASLKAPWETSTQHDENLQNEADQIIRSITAGLEQDWQSNINHLPIVIPTTTLSSIASPIFREDSERLALHRLRAIRMLLPVHIHVSKRMQMVLLDKKFSNAKIHSQIKENGDFDIIILADPPDRGPYFLMKLLFKKTRRFLRTKHRRRLECPGMTVVYNREENEERAFIEMKIGCNKIIIRDLSSQGYSKHFNPKRPFNVFGESSSFRSKFLTDRLILSTLKAEKGFPQDIYPFMVRCFFRITKTNKLLNLSGLSKLQQIEEEHSGLNEFFDFVREPQNLFMMLYEAQTSLIGFGDYDCVQKNRDGSYSVNEYSESAKTCRSLVTTLSQQIVPKYIYGMGNATSVDEYSKKRMGMGFATSVDEHSEERTGMGFATSVDEHSKKRMGMGFATSVDEHSEERTGMGFATSVDEHSKKRMGMGFATSVDEHSKKRMGMGFATSVDEHSKKRMGMGFATSVDEHSEERTGMGFATSVDEHSKKRMGMGFATSVDEHSEERMKCLQVELAFSSPC